MTHKSYHRVNEIQWDTQADRQSCTVISITKVTRLRGNSFLVMLNEHSHRGKRDHFLLPSAQQTSGFRMLNKPIESYLLQSSASASWGKKMSVLGMERVPRVSDFEAVVPLLMCWTAAAAGLSWTGCRLVLQERCWSLLRPQGSRCQPAHSVPGHGARCLSGCHPYSTPGWSHCGHHSQRSWWWWLRGD